MGWANRGCGCAGFGIAGQRASALGAACSAEGVAACGAEAGKALRGAGGTTGSADTCACAVEQGESSSVDATDAW